jgi:hypothetical protein
MAAEMIGSGSPVVRATTAGRVLKAAASRSAARHRSAEMARPRHRHPEGGRTPSADRRATKQLFGDEGAQAIATRLEREGVSAATPLQGLLFPEMEATPTVRGRAQRSCGGRIGGEGSDPDLTASREATTLDGVHAAMLLQAAGRTNALRPAQGGARARIGLPAPRQCAFSPLPEGQRGETSARRDAACCSEVMTCSISPTGPT